MDGFLTTCDNPLLADPRYDEIILHPKTSAVLKVFERPTSQRRKSRIWDRYTNQYDGQIHLNYAQRRHSAYMLCRLIGQINEASIHYRITHCDNNSSSSSNNNDDDDNIRFKRIDVIT
jgi:hypothetical protein